MRRASTADLEALVAHRRAMFHDMGYNDEVALNLARLGWCDFNFPGRAPK
jgi:hypothetical protein